MTKPLSNYELLAAALKGVGGAPKSSDIAKLIASNASTSIKALPSKKKEDPSIMGRIFDVLSRGNYASAEFFKGSAKNEFGPLDPETWKGVLEGITGERKTTFHDVLEEIGVGEAPGSAALGLGLDIFADPTTYIPVAGLAAKAKGLTKAGKADEANKAILADTPLGKKLLEDREPVRPESFGMPAGKSGDVPVALDPSRVPMPRAVDTSDSSKIDIREGAWPGSTKGEPTLPGMEDIVPSRVRKTKTEDAVAKRKEAVGQIPLPFKDFSVKALRASRAATGADRAEDIVSKVAKGDPMSTARIIPKPKPTPEARDIRDGSDVLSKFDPSKSTADLNKKSPDTINAKQQAKLYYRAIDQAKKRFRKPNSPVNKPRIQAAAFRIYIAAEKMLEDQGKVFRLGTGENGKLSDAIQELGGSSRAQEVLDQFTKDIVPGTAPWQAVQGMKAAEAVKEAPVVGDVVSRVLEAKTSYKSLSDAENFDLDKFLKRSAGPLAKAAGASPAAEKVTSKIIDAAIRSDKSAAQLSVEQSRRELDDIVARGVQSKKLNHTLTRALEKDLGTLPSWAVNNNKATEFIMGRVATWWGQKDLRPMTLNAIGAAHATASARAKVLENTFANYTTAEAHDALKIAQGVGIPSNDRARELSEFIDTMVGNLVGQANGQSVLLRSAVDFDRLNRWLKHDGVGFQFSKGKQKNLLGETVDYSKGSDWVNSWKTWGISEHPRSFLFKLQSALEQATREKAVFTELGERFGSPVVGKGFTNKITGHPYLDGYYFPADIANQIPRMVKDWNVSNWTPQSDMLKMYDRLMSMWKSGVTIYRPAHHIRNMIGDVYLGWMDGVNSIKPYRLAAQVQRSMKGAYSTLEDVDNLVAAGVLSKGYKTPEPNQILFRNRSGVAFTAEQIGAVAHQKGLLEHVNTLEDIIDMGESGKGILNAKPFGGKVQAVARGASELQSHNARLAHMIDKVMKSRGSNLEEIFESASRRARKWHPSGLDLTEFEKKTMRRIMPFYTWMRKSVPLLVEGLVMNPGKTVIPAKVADAVQESQGIETPGRHDPFPVDQMFPHWMKAEGIGPLSLPDGILGSVSNQTPEGYVMGGMGLNPLSSLMSQVSDPGRTALTSISPVAQIPIELAQGRKLFTQQPISGPEAPPGAMAEYVGSQVPIVGALQGITGITPFGTETKAAANSDTARREAIVNWLTGFGVKGSGPYIRSAQYEFFAPGRGERRFGKQEQMRTLREGQ